MVDIGRRGGKTEFALNELIKEAIRIPGLYWYVGPSYKQAKSIAWVRLKNLLKPARDHWKFNENELYAENIHTGARIELKGADNEESLLGVGLKGVVMDESAMTKAIVWPRIIRPMLADAKGWAIFISTPKGMDWFYDLWMKGQDANEKDWISWKYDTSINKYIDQEEIDAMKADMPERLFLQEVMAEFLDDSSGVFRGLKSCLAGELKVAIPGRFYTLGVDLAKSYDFTVLTVMDTVTRELVYFDRFNEISWKEQKTRILDIARTYNNALCVIDSTGIGDPIVEDLETSGVSLFYGNDGKAGYQFTNKSKVKLINLLSIAIEQRLITIPKSLNVLIEELRVFEYTIGVAGAIKYQAPEGKHDDCVISLALAVWGMRHLLKEAQIVRADIMVDEEMRDRQGRGEREVEHEEEQYGAFHGGY